MKVETRVLGLLLVMMSLLSLAACGGGGGGGGCGSGGSGGSGGRGMFHALSSGGTVCRNGWIFTVRRFSRVTIRQVTT